MKAAADYISEKTNGFIPQIGIILGSGLGDFADDFKSVVLPYKDIPGFEVSNIEGHKGQLVFADINGKKVVMMQGRYHFYEGYSMQTLSFPVKVMKMTGVETLIITNAAGAICKDFIPGDLMIITDHINLMGANPLIGKNDNSLGERFPDMSEVYSKKLIEIAEQSAKELNISCQKGVYAATTGPNYETPAEINMLRISGADAVGMSTVPEAIMAHYLGMKVLGISCLTNYAAGITQCPLSHSEVIETANKVKSSFKNLILAVMNRL